MCGAVDLQAALPLPSLSRRLRITTITAHPQGQRNAIACWVACRLLRRSSIGAALSTAERTGEELQAQLGPAAARHAAPEVLPELYAPPDLPTPPHRSHHAHARAAANSPRRRRSPPLGGFAKKAGRGAGWGRDAHGERGPCHTSAAVYAYLTLLPRC